MATSTPEAPAVRAPADNTPPDDAKDSPGAGRPDNNDSPPAPEPKDDISDIVNSIGYIATECWMAKEGIEAAVKRIEAGITLVQGVMPDNDPLPSAECYATETILQGAVKQLNERATAILDISSRLKRFHDAREGLSPARWRQVDDVLRQVNAAKAVMPPDVGESLPGGTVELVWTALDNAIAKLEQILKHDSAPDMAEPEPQAVTP